MTAVKIAPTSSKKLSWKPIKSKDPDCGTYHVARGRPLIEKSPVVYKMNRAPTFETGSMKENKSKETFTTIMV